MTAILSWIVRSWTDVENNIVSVERVNEYADTAKEVSDALSPLLLGGTKNKNQIYTVKQFLETVGVTIILKVCCVNIESLLRTLNPAEERLFPLWYYPLQASWTIESSSLPMDWPLKGTLEFQEYGLQYRKGLELALKGITLNIHEREKVSHNPHSL